MGSRPRGGRPAAPAGPRAARMGRAGMMAARASRRTNSSTTQAGPGGADPADHRAEPVARLSARARSRRRTGRTPGDLDPVGERRRGDLAEHRQQHPPLVNRGETADRHHGGPVPAVVPAAPPAHAPGRRSSRVNEEGQRHRHTIRTAPKRQDQATTTGPGQPALAPRQDNQGEGQVRYGVADHEPDQRARAAGRAGPAR